MARNKSKTREVAKKAEIIATDDEMHFILARAASHREEHWEEYLEACAIAGVKPLAVDDAKSEFDSFLSRVRGSVDTELITSRLEPSDLSQAIPERGVSRKSALVAANDIGIDEFKLLCEKARGLGRDFVLFNGNYYRYFEARGWRLADHFESLVIEQAARAGGMPWFDGPVISTNLGDMIVAPYIKKDGTRVVGHTKNSRGKGRARTRTNGVKLTREQINSMKKVE
ncbi:hypothetical protein [Algisphaera agarilytica]|uniref:Uncharacterized protein n=1 Tax=Algisphaera agarilytica TaxID=1385975 RepID=A0A7X0H7R7_9BACT|nr:hypothetical protein [Algisphaera agarilytica]MBB6430663.1 hypothetical protein [Algisphaera agarilytica]